MGLALMSIASCAGPSNETSSRDSGASLFDQLEAAQGRHVRTGGATASDAEPASAQMRELAVLWKSFLDQQPGWPERREAWCRHGDAARTLLVENLVRTMMRARDAGEGALFHRCRTELLEHRELATALFVEALASHRGDQVLRNLAAETLAFFGPGTAVPIIHAARAADERGQCALLAALKLLTHAEARPFMEERAVSTASFKVRIEALDGLARLADPESIATCRACLLDRDPSVRRFAFKLAGALKSQSTALLPDVLAAWQTAAQAGELELTRAARWAAQQLAGRDFGADLARWPRGRGN